MKLKEFIKKLDKISDEQGDDLDVVMADNIPVVDPIFLDNFCNSKKVVITDGK